jgi:hypothetical protein
MHGRGEHTSYGPSYSVKNSGGRAVSARRLRCYDLEGTMRPPSILDVLGAVKAVAAAHPEVASWWYAPGQRLRLAGELPHAGEAEVTVEIVVEMSGGTDGAQSPGAVEAIGRELSRAMGMPVRARAHRGSAEERSLFRLVSVKRARAV